MRRRISELVSWEAYQGSAEDSHGNEIESWSPPVSKGIYAYNPGTTQDLLESGHDRDIIKPSIYAPNDVVMGARDRVTVRGLLFEVDGETKEFRNPHGSRMDGNQIDLRRVNG